MTKICEKKTDDHISNVSNNSPFILETCWDKSII